jgi:hypothetical protein
MFSCILIWFVHEQYLERNAPYRSHDYSKDGGNQTVESEESQDTRVGPEFVLYFVSYMEFPIRFLDRQLAFLTHVSVVFLSI